MATIRDVARRAGVSIATVSRVLNNVGHPVRESTRQRVLEAARELNFSPNDLAKSLLRGRTATIGLLVPDIANTYYADILSGVEAVASERQFAVLLGNTNRDPERQVHYLRVFQEKRVDGVILAGGDTERGARSAPWTESGLRIIWIGYGAPGIPAIHPDNEGGAMEATRLLVALGHRAVGCITGPPESNSSRARFAGYRRALQEAGLPLRPEWVTSGGFRPEGGYEAVLRIYRHTSGERPTALFVANDQMAIGALRAFQELGLRVPEDVAVVSFDDVPIARFLRPALTTVAIAGADLGRQAMEMLFEFLDTGRPPASRQLTTRLVVRESSGGPVATSQA